jgi:hypothetical protein
MNPLCCSIIILNYDIFRFSCRFIVISHFCKSCEYDLWEFFIYFLFSFLFSYPNLLILDINVFLHGRLHHASKIMGYMSIVVAFVTFNIVGIHINISSIRSTFNNFMSKVITSQTITRKETLIPGRK